ncbi:MAG TPA: Flp pilus assembly protein CpaB [Steroidobacteraceae bacterium]
MKGTMITLLMVTGALGAGAAAAYFANDYIDRTVEQRRAEIDARYTPAKVVVANTDLSPGTFLSGRTAAIREVPRAFLHSDAVLAEDWDRIAGRVLVHPLRSGEPILTAHLAQDITAGFSSQLPQGMRALTFPVDEESSIAGMLAPGDRIDLFFTTSSNNESVTVPLLTNVPVIATGVRTLTNVNHFGERRDGYSFNTITVAVTPEDAAKIAHAQDAGKLTTMLRQPRDEAPIQVARITKSTLLNGARSTKSTARHRVEIILGGV